VKASDWGFEGLELNTCATFQQPFDPRLPQNSPAIERGVAVAERS